jgi:hypothetical protein
MFYRSPEEVFAGEDNLTDRTIGGGRKDKVEVGPDFRPERREPKLWWARQVLLRV